jgi:alanine racemase
MPVAGIHRPAWAEISRSALAHNVTVLRGLVGDRALCAVIKANGYGHGATLVAPALLEAGADLLAVAIIDEGIELREAGITAPILLLSEIPADTLHLALTYDLSLTVGSLQGARAVVETARATGRVAVVHVKVDTGMYRQGVRPDEVGDVVAVLDDPAVVLEGLFTHFPVADGEEEADVAFTQAQTTRFEAIVAELAERGVRPRYVHLANSAALLGHPAAYGNLLRPGLALYGYAPAGWLRDELARRGLELRPALSLRAHVVAVRRVAAGERPSYGRRRALEHDATIITVPFGYADGYPRRLFEAGAEVLVHGQRVPLAGTVTMDQLLVNAGDLPVALGDDVVLLGTSGSASITADDWAAWASTIAWEILCGIGARVPRVVVD